MLAELLPSWICALSLCGSDSRVVLSMLGAHQPPNATLMLIVMMDPNVSKLAISHNAFGLISLLLMETSRLKQEHLKMFNSQTTTTTFLLLGAEPLLDVLAVILAHAEPLTAVKVNKVANPEQDSNNLQLKLKSLSSRTISTPTMLKSSMVLTFPSPSSLLTPKEHHLIPTTAEHQAQRLLQLASEPAHGNSLLLLMTTTMWLLEAAPAMLMVTVEIKNVESVSILGTLTFSKRLAVI